MVVLTGCGGNSGGGGSSCTATAQLLRDPSSGACHVVAVWDAEGNEDPAQDQAPCHSFCASLPEADCISVAGCHPAVLAGPSSVRGQFLGCWNTVPAAPVRAVACVELDAESCSRNDRCAAWYREATGGTMQFDHCAGEPAYRLASHVDRGSDSRSATRR